MYKYVYIYIHTRVYHIMGLIPTLIMAALGWAAGFLIPSDEFYVGLLDGLLGVAGWVAGGCWDDDITYYPLVI